MRRLPSPVPAPQALTWHQGNCWLGSRDARRLVCLDAGKWTVLEDVAAPGIPWSAVAVGNALYLTSGEGPDDDRYLRRYEPGRGFDDSYRVAIPDFTGSYLSHDGSSLYLSQWYKHRLLQLGEDGGIRREIGVGAEICGHVFRRGDALRPARHGAGRRELAGGPARSARGPVPGWEEVARVPFACRSLAFDGRAFLDEPPRRQRNRRVLPAGFLTRATPMTDLPLTPSRDAFLALAARGDANLIPVSTELMADCDTPVAAFQKLLDEDTGGEDCLFLLESAENSEQIGRYSFLGSRPAAVFESRGTRVTITEQNAAPRGFTAEGGDPFAELERFLARYRPAALPAGHAAAPFVGGAVGYLSYDAVRFFEGTVPPPPPDQLGLPDMLYLITDTLIVFDHRFRRLRVLVNVFTEGREPGAAYDEARAKLGRLVRRLRAPSHLRPGLVYPELPRPAAARQQHDARGVRGRRRARPGAHPRGRHLPVRALAALPDAVHGRRAVALPGAAVHQPVAVYVRVPLRQPVLGGGQLAGDPRPRAGRHGGNPPHRGHPAPGRRRRRRTRRWRSRCWPTRRNAPST